MSLSAAASSCFCELMIFDDFWQSLGPPFGIFFFFSRLFGKALGLTKTPFGEIHFCFLPRFLK